MGTAEKIGVEQPAIAWLTALGYHHLAGAEVQCEFRHRAPVLQHVLEARLQALNPWLVGVSGGVQRALIELQKCVNDELLPANQCFWQMVVHRSDIQVKDNDGRMRSVRFFDANDASNNDFHVVDQFVGRNADGDIFKPDLLLFVNGLPLGLLECKAQHHSLDEALSQIDGYQAHFGPHFVFNQVCVGLNGGDARYGTILTPPRSYAKYRLTATEQAELAAFKGEPATPQEELLWALFAPARFLELITHFVLFESRDGKVTKKLPRYQQWRAVRKTIERLRRPKPVGGVIWHTQGSGKSLTMALLARMLRAESVGLGNPSVLVLTDRRDLDIQIRDTFHAVGIKAIQAVSVAGLMRLLTNDYGSVFTSTVQKFQENDNGDGLRLTATGEDEDDSLLHELRHRRIRDGKAFLMVEERNLNYGRHDEHGVLLPAKWTEVRRMPIDFRVLSNKPNFYVLVDEAHRSQYDFLAAFMRASLPNAKFIAFTGTPLLQEDKHTLVEFGGGDYIDEYRLHEAVEDGATLPIKYNDAWVELSAKEKLDEAFNKQFEQADPAQKQLLKRELLGRWRQSASRIDAICEHLVEHFLAHVRAKGLKAMLVCDGREMAVRYKDKLDALMKARAERGEPTFDSRVVISLNSMTASRTGASVKDEAGEYQVEAEQLQTIEERVRGELKRGEEPVAMPSERIANFVGKLFPLPYGDEAVLRADQPQANNVGLIIVSDMLLTGWDAPIVSTMYLDKALKEHTLLQAIARVNRTYEGKNAGYIVDYHGVVDHLDHALKIYGGELKPAQVWTQVETDLPKLQAACAKLLELLPRKFDPLKQQEEYKADAERFLDPIDSPDKVDAFLNGVAAFNKLLDTILPDPRAAPFRPYFNLFAEIRLMLRDKMPDGKSRERVTRLESLLLQRLLDEHIEASPAKSLLGRPVSILNASDMARLKQNAKPASRALVMKTQTKQTITAGQQKDPAFFDKLAKEFEKLLEEEKAGRISQAQFLQQLELFSQRIQQHGQTGFASAMESAVFHYLSDKLGEDTARAATVQLFSDSELKKTLAAENWRAMHDMHPAIKDELRRILTPVSGWGRAVAREHASRILDILLKN